MSDSNLGVHGGPVVTVLILGSEWGRGKILSTDLHRIKWCGEATSQFTNGSCELPVPLDGFDAILNNLAELVAAKVRTRLADDGAQPRPRLLTAEQAAEYIGRSEQAVRHLIHQRDIPVVRNGRCVRIDRKNLDSWIENNKT